MLLQTLLFSNILAVLTSCSGQITSLEATKALSKQHSIPIAIGIRGDTVKELGNNIMTVYQDKKNNYWFGS